MRGSLATRVKIAEKIADSDESSDADRLRALDFLARYGLGTQSEQKVDATLKVAGVVVLPTLTPE